MIHLYHRMEYIYNEKDGGLCIHNEGYQKGYRYSMIHDQKCVWIGLFLVDQNKQRTGLGTKIINKFIKCNLKPSYLMKAYIYINNRNSINSILFYFYYTIY